MKFRTLWILPLLLLLVSARFQATEAQSIQDNAQLYAAAKKEGEVRVWGGTDIPVMQALGKAFAVVYPGISVVPFEITPSALVQRLLAEKSAGAELKVDILQGDIASFRPLIERDMLASFDDWTTLFPDAPKQIFNNNGMSVQWAHNDQPVAYNVNLVGKNVPKTWDDLLSPQWKGKILVEDRAKGLAHLLSVWGEAKFTDYMAKLVKQKLFYVHGGTTLAQGLATGEGAIAIGTYGFSIQSLSRKGAPIGILPIKPIRVRLISNYFIKGSKNTNAARLFAVWMATPEAQKILGKTWGGRGLLTKGSGADLAEIYEKAGYNFETDLVALEDHFDTKEIRKMEKEALALLGEK